MKTSAHRSIKALARLLRFAPALRVTDRRAPVKGQLWPEGDLPAVAADRNRNQPIGTAADLKINPDRTTHLLKTPDKLTCYGQVPYSCAHSNDCPQFKRNEPLGVQTSAPFLRNFMAESVLGDLLTDALRRAFHADIAIMNSGGIRANLRAGDLLYSDIYEVSPFDDRPRPSVIWSAAVIPSLLFRDPTAAARPPYSRSCLG